MIIVSFVQFNQEREEFIPLIFCWIIYVLIRDVSFFYGRDNSNLQYFVRLYVLIKEVRNQIDSKTRRFEFVNS